MKLPTFEDYLKDRHAENFPTLLDDDMSDHFDDWVGSLDTDDVMRYAEDAVKRAYDLGCLHGHKDGCEHKY